MPFHPLWLVALLVIVLIIFGPGRLPELGGAIGKGIKEFRKATNDLRDEVTRVVTPEETTAGPATPVQPAPSPAPTAATATTEPAKAEAETKKS